MHAGQQIGNLCQLDFTSLHVVVDVRVGHTQGGLLSDQSVNCNLTLNGEF